MHLMSELTALIVAVSFLAFFSITSALATQCEPNCEISLDIEHPHEALEQREDDFGITVRLRGEPSNPITTTIREPSVDRLIRRLAYEGGYLVQKVGTEYTLFGFGQDIDDVSLTVMATHISAQSAVNELSKFGAAKATLIETSNVILLQGNLDQVRKSKEFLKLIDQARPNVFLELLVVEYFHGDTFSWAFDVLNGQKGKVSDATFSPGSGVASGLYDVIADLDRSFRFNLRALVGDQDARVVTNPHVAVRSGEPGNIDFKEELNVILSNQTENFGVTRTLEKLEAGVSLSVTPQVLSSGYIDLSVTGSVGVFVPAPEGQFAIDRQTVKTEVLLETGKTLVIAGLIAKQVSISESGIPFLRKTPLIGGLFRSESRNEQYVETVIYITPHIDEPDVFLPDNIGKDVDSEFDRLNDIVR